MRRKFYLCLCLIGTCLFFASPIQGDEIQLCQLYPDEPLERCPKCKKYNYESEPCKTPNCPANPKTETRPPIPPRAPSDIFALEPQPPHPPQRTN